MFFHTVRYPPLQLFHPSSVERILEHITRTINQHPVQQFFAEDMMLKQLHELHTQLGASYYVRDQLRLFSLITLMINVIRTVAHK
jgi:hypothetical protein